MREPKSVVDLIALICGAVGIGGAILLLVYDAARHHRLGWPMVALLALGVIGSIVYRFVGEDFEKENNDADEPQ
jgi:hypothetical protein